MPAFCPRPPPNPEPFSVSHQTTTTTRAYTQQGEHLPTTDDRPTDDGRTLTSLVPRPISPQKALQGKARQGQGKTTTRSFGGPGNGAVALGKLLKLSTRADTGEDREPLPGPPFLSHSLFLFLVTRTRHHRGWLPPAPPCCHPELSHPENRESFFTPYTHTLSLFPRRSPILLAFSPSFLFFSFLVLTR